MPNLGFTDNNVLVYPGPGIDSGIFKVDEKILVASTDPITASSHLIGRWVAYITTNDVLASGGIPKWFLLNLLLPASYDKKQLLSIMRDLSNSLNKMKVTLLGGHTERTPNISFPIAVGTAIGIANKVLKPSNIRVGDKIYLFGEVAVEGAYILFKEKEDILKEYITSAEKKEIDNFPEKISIYRYAEKLIRNCIDEIRWMHDPTEGGVYNGLYEIAISSKKALRVNLSHIKLNSIVKKICEKLDINPYKLLSSGSLIVVVGSEKEKEFVKKCWQMNIKPVFLGEIYSESKAGEITIENADEYEFKDPHIDEIWKIFH